MFITLKDVVEAGISPASTKAFFKQHDLDWATFISDGLDVPVEILSTIPEPFMSRLVDMPELTDAQLKEFKRAVK